MTGESLPTPDIDGTASWVLLRLKPRAGDEAFEFGDEDYGDALVRAAQPWSILVVDDDLEVHRAVELALMMVNIHGRPLKLSHCSSAAEARSVLLGGSPNVDLVLLDVVMETADAGLTLLNEIRALPVMRNLPVVLHTGQPGQAQEQAVRAQFDVSGYLTKSSVTRQSLIGALDAILGGSTLAT